MRISSVFCDIFAKSVVAGINVGGVCIIAFSSRLFYTKAIQAWRDNSAFGRVSLVRQYFQCVQGIACLSASMSCLNLVTRKSM